MLSATLRASVFEYAICPGGGIAFTAADTLSEVRWGSEEWNGAR